MNTIEIALMHAFSAHLHHNIDQAGGQTIAVIPNKPSNEILESVSRPRYVSNL